MSAFGGKADIALGRRKCPLMTKADIKAAAVQQRTLM
jgi:hypothetical protein